MATLTAQQVAHLAGGDLKGADNLVLTGVASLEDAQAGDVSFLGNPRYRSRVLPSHAGVVLVPAAFEEAPPPGRAWVLCQEPSTAFTKVVAAFAPPPVRFPPGIHARASVDPSAQVPDSAHVGACAVIEAGVRIGARSVVGAGACIGQDAKVGEDCLIYPNVSIRERCVIGNRVIIHCGTVVGSDGFGYVSGPAGHQKIPQVGIVQIDDDVELGALVAIDRARFGRTWIKKGTKVDNLVQVAHNVVIGENCLVIAQVGIAGSSRLGRGVIAAGQVGIAGHLEIGDGAILMAQSGISKDIPAGGIMMGSPAVDRREFVRNQAHVHRVPKIQEALEALKQEVAALRQRLAP